ncbi:MAG: hypothetical protein JWQ27_42 [Ferruginibacter sp.]|nr:hypothetical protein [Ferruginibacter sp.]
MSDLTARCCQTVQGRYCRLVIPKKMQSWQEPVSNPSDPGE